MKRSARAAEDITDGDCRSAGLSSPNRLITRRLAIALVSLLLAGILGACGPDAIPPDTGVRGNVLIGPACPVVQFGTECPDQPFQSLLEVQRADGHVVARVESDEAGWFEIALLPGDYILAPAPPNPGAPPYASPLPFTVTLGVWTTLTVQYDSGIR